MELTLENKRNKRAVNKDFYHLLNFDRSSMVIPESDINSVINTYKVFEDERNQCTKYRLNITLSPFMSNVLANKTSIITDKITGIQLTGSTMYDKIQTINDADYDYKCGYDIFDNNYFRIPTFKTGNTLNDFQTRSDLSKLLSIEKTINNNVFQDNGWIGFSNITKIKANKLFSTKKACETIDLFPTRDYFLFNPIYLEDGLKDNWDYVLTYPYESLYNNTLVTNDQNNINGIPIVSSKIVSIDSIQYIIIQTVYNHGLNNGDIIKIKRDTPDTDKTYLIYDIGDENSENKNSTFKLDVNKYSDLLQIENIENNRVCRVINKIDSEYYIRKFRKIPNFIDEVDIITEDNINNKILTGSTIFHNETYQPAFSKNIFNDPIYQIQYIEPIDIKLLKDNLGRPLSEIYFTILKKNIINDNIEPFNVFTKVMSGINESAGVTGYCNIRIINNHDTEVPLEDKITITGGTVNGVGNNNIFYGDIVEYNKSIVKERILENVMHRFNTTQREDETNSGFTYTILDTNGTFTKTTISLPLSKEGYYYKPHYKIPLKNYSYVIKESEIPLLLNCHEIVSGTTFNNEIVTLSGQTNSDVKNIIVTLSSLSGLTNLQDIRITNKYDERSYINTKINISYTIKNSILIPYNNSFFGDLSGLTITDYYLNYYKDSDTPLYCQNMGDGTCKWRDILREGSFDNNSEQKEELIFTNGYLYLNKFFNFYLMRQDAFGGYGLISNTFPSDPYGISLNDTIINNLISKSNEQC